MPISPASTGLIRPLVLAQDLDTLAGPLPGELVKHQLTSGFLFRSYWQSIRRYARPARGRRRTRRARNRGGVALRGAGGRRPLSAG